MTIKRLEQVPIGLQACSSYIHRSITKSPMFQLHDSPYVLAHKHVCIFSMEQRPVMIEFWEPLRVAGDLKAYKAP
jgi:hypothetical protein